MVVVVFMILLPPVSSASLKKVGAESVVLVLGWETLFYKSQEGLSPKRQYSHQLKVMLAEELNSNQVLFAGFERDKLHGSVSGNSTNGRCSLSFSFHVTPERDILYPSPFCITPQRTLKKDQLKW